MKTYMFCVVSLALGIFLCLQYDILAGDKASDLQGTWTVVSCEFQGKPRKDAIGEKVIFRGDKVTFNAGKAEDVIRFVLDTSKKPKQIDFLMDGSDTAKSSLGIYVIEGDTLKICFEKGANQEKERPTEFVSKTDGDILMVLKREKK